MVTEVKIWLFLQKLVMFWRFLETLPECYKCSTSWSGWYLHRVFLNLKKLPARLWFVHFSYVCDISVLKIIFKNCSSMQTKEEIGKILKSGFNSSESAVDPFMNLKTIPQEDVFRSEISTYIHVPQVKYSCMSFIFENITEMI